MNDAGLAPRNSSSFEGAELAVQDERAGGKLGHCAGDVAETGGMIATVAADETYVLAVFVGDQASAVVPLSYTQPSRWNDSRTSVGCIGEMAGGHRSITYRRPACWLRRRVL